MTFPNGLETRPDTTRSESYSPSCRCSWGGVAGCERVLCIVSLVLLLATTSWAQSDASDSTERRHVFSTNPLTMIVASWYNGEYERRLTQAATLGLSASRLSFGSDAAFVSLNAAFRYYPGGNALRGFYLGPRVGLFHHSIYGFGDGISETDMDVSDEAGLFLGVGFELGYAWLMGVEEHLSVSLGGGASRGFNDHAIPMIRFLNIGWAF